MSSLCALSHPIRVFAHTSGFHANFLRAMSSAMGKRLEGKTIVVTGASSGIGRSTAMEFARTSPRSLRLVLAARRINSLKQVAEDIRKEVGDGVKVLPFQLDVGNPEGVGGVM